MSDIREVVRPVADLWSDPATVADADRLSQLLLGEPVRVHESDGDRVQVTALWQPSSKDPGGYPGWMAAADLARPVDRVEGQTAYVTDRVVTLDSGEGSLDLSFGTVLWVAAVDGRRVRVQLPGGREGTLPQAGVRLSEKSAPGTVDVARMLAGGRAFLGLEYVWGGLSQAGLDCSGLVHLTLRAQGVVVPRDAFDQATSVTAVDQADVRAGDLYFFAREGRRIHHVGIATGVSPDGEAVMLHASETDRFLMEGPLSQDRLDTLVLAGRIQP